MNFLKYYSKLGLIICSILVLLGSNLHADESNINLNIGQNATEMISLSRPITNIYVGNNSIVSATKYNSKKIAIRGKRAGKTTVKLMNRDKLVKKYNVTVHQDLQSIKKTFYNLFPKENVGVEMVNDSVALVGSVSDAETAAQIVQVASEYISNDGKIINLMKIKSGQQVMLRVRVGELKRDALSRLGLGLQGIISAGPSVIGALEREGAFKTLAEPTLTAISGETAEFLAGGEFPVPSIQAGRVMSVEYKPVGVSVDFTPYVLSKNRIRLDVASEVSEVNSTAMNVNSASIPSISTRRANTTVELASGESFMIAGLINNMNSSVINKVPGLGDIPILSVLFSSIDFKSRKSELVIAVTPYLADPVSPDQIRMPGEDYEVSSPLEALFLGNMNLNNNSNGSMLEGKVGYITE